MGNDIDVVRCGDGDNGRSYASHIICGTHLKVGDVLIFRWAVILINDKAEEVIEVYVIRDRSQARHVGFLSRKLVKQKEKYMNKMAIVIEDLRVSDEPQKRRRSHRNVRVVVCRMLDEIKEQFRE